MIATLLAALLAVVSTATNSVSYACNGSTAVFSVTYPYQTYTDLVVTSTTAGGVVTPLVYTTDYTVNRTSTTSTATLTLTNPAVKCPSGSTLKIARTVAYTQTYSFKNQTAFDQTLHEKAYDRLEMQIQQLVTALPAAVALGLQDEGSAQGNIATLNCVGPLTCTASAGAGTLTITSAAPATIPNSGNTNVEGTAVTLSRTDHSHALAVGPMLDATTTAGQSIPNAGVDTLVVFGTVVTDSDSAYASGTGRYTVPTGKGGDYYVSSFINWNGAATTPAVKIYKNAVFLRTIANLGAGTINGMQGGSLTERFAAGDVIDIRVKHDSGGAVTLLTLAGYNYFTLKRIQ